MRQHGQFGQLMHGFGHVGVDGFDDLRDRARAGLHSADDLLFAVAAVGDVFFDAAARVGYDGPVAGHKRGQSRQFQVSPQRSQVVFHIAFGRRDDDRAESDDAIPGEQAPRALFVKTEVAARMARSPHRAQPPCQSRRALRDFYYFPVFDEAVYANLAADGFGGQPVRRDRQVEFFGQMRNAADVIG